MYDISCSPSCRRQSKSVLHDIGGIGVIGIRKCLLVRGFVYPQFQEECPSEFDLRKRVLCREESKCFSWKGLERNYARICAQARVIASVVFLDAELECEKKLFESSARTDFCSSGITSGITITYYISTYYLLSIILYSFIYYHCSLLIKHEVIVHTAS